MTELLDMALLDSDLEEDVLLLDVLTVRNNIRERSIQYDRFNLDNLALQECKLLFRFEKHDIIKLKTALDLPPVIRMDNRYVVSGLEGLCIYLRRLAYPNRLTDLENLFGLSNCYLSVICNTVMEIISENKGHLLRDLNNLRWLDRNKLRYYCKSVSEKGAPIQNCWAFINGTVRPICRPSIDQESYYSGHKRTHCVKYQSLLCPDGIIVSLLGPYPGRRHDAGIFAESLLYNQLERCALFPDEKFVVYGDSAYPIEELLLKPFSTRLLTIEQEIFNRGMSSVRQCVEWGFSKILTEFAFVDYKKNQKLLLQNIGDMYKTATILTNCHTCLYGSQTGTYFNIEPLTLEEYLS